MISRKCCLRVALLALLPITLAIAANPSGNGRKSPDQTAQASARIMEELMEIYKSDSYKRGVFHVEPVDDNLYEWNVKLFFTGAAEESPPAILRDMQRLKESGKEDHVMLRVSFPGDYPREPPFVRVIYPTLMQNNVSKNGSVCMYELSKQGWVSDFSMEGLLLTIIHMFETQNRVNFLTNAEKRQQEYTEAKAREAYEEQMKLHAWDTSRSEHMEWFEGA